MPAFLRKLAFPAGSLSVVDQAAVSAGNFGTGVILARALDQTSFAAYVLAVAVTFFVLQLQYGLLLNPLMVNGAAQEDSAFCRLVRANAWIQSGFSLLSCLILGGIVVAWEPLRAVGLPLIVLSVLWQVQEFCRRVQYTRGLIGSALLNNVINYDLQVLVLLAAARFIQLNLATALWISALTSLLAAVIGVWQLRRFRTRESADVRGEARNTLRIARWTIGSAVLTAAGHQSTPLLVAAIDGLSSAAVLGVLYQITGPLNLLNRPLQNYFTPRAIRSLASCGTVGLNRTLRRAALLTGPGYVLYAMVLAIEPTPLLAALYGSTYVEHANAVRIFAVVQLAGFAVNLLVVELTARRMQKQILSGVAGFTVVLYLLGSYLTAQFGLIGLVWSLGAATLAQVTLYVRTVIRARSVDRGPIAGGPIEPTQETRTPVI